MPLLHSRVTKATYETLVDKVKHRLASWKGRFLSLAGRATLIQAVTASIPIYAMQTTKLPASVCDDLDKLNRNFFWGGGEKKQKIHLCQWDLVCRPKCKGVMGFKKTIAMNQAMLAKIGWRLHSKDKGLWAKFFETKYMQGSTILDPSLRSNQGCSSTWRSILHGSTLLSQGLAWRIGKWDSTHFWTDKWVTDQPLAQQEEVLQLIDLNCVVYDFSKNGWWDVNKLCSALHDDLVQKILNVPAGFMGSLPDSHIWRPSPNGIFSVKTAYGLFFEGPWWPDYDWKFLWSLRTPPKLYFFLWLTAQGKLLTNEQRVKRNLAEDSACAVCDYPTESILHIFRDCNRAKDVWNDLLISPHNSSFFQMDFKPWLKANLMSKIKWQADVPWYLVFVATCWHLWKWRNKFIFPA
ncbi:hypothetical protein CerSpe_217190 [Prunus speciosa]